MASMPIMIIYTFSSQDFLDFGNESNQLTQQSHILFYIVLFALCYFTGSKKPEQSLKKHNKLLKMYTSTILVKVLQFTDVARPLQHVFMSTEPCRQMKAPEVVI